MANVEFSSRSSTTALELKRTLVYRCRRRRLCPVHDCNIAYWLLEWHPVNLSAFSSAQQFTSIAISIFSILNKNKSDKLHFISTKECINLNQYWSHVYSQWNLILFYFIIRPGRQAGSFHQLRSCFSKKVNK